MSPDTDRAWTTDTEETQAIEAVYRVVIEMAGVLHAFDGARYTDPSGGHTVG